jgi:hypothetical protein
MKNKIYNYIKNSKQLTNRTIEKNIDINELVSLYTKSYGSNIKHIAEFIYDYFIYKKFI